MILRWNYNKLFEKKADIDEEINTSDIDKEKLLKIESVELSNMLKIPKTCYATLPKIDINPSSETLKASDKIAKFKIIKNNYESKITNINEDIAIPIIRKYLDSEELKIFNDMFDRQAINFDYKSFGNNKSLIYFLPYHKEVYIGLDYNETLTDIRIFMHEMGHAKQHLKINNINELANYYKSFYMETFSILNELIFIDNLDLPYEEINKERYSFLCNYNIHIKNGKVTYAHSYALAHYLFDLYKNDTSKYNEYIDMLSEFIKIYDDKTIINKMDIKSSDMVKSYKKYLNSSR